MGRSILGSPSELNVRPGQTETAMSTAEGAGLSGCTAGMTCTFTILTRDVSANQGKGGQDVRVILTGPCTVPLEDPITQVIQECPGPDTITATHEDSKDGSFAVSYTITATGNYSVHIKFGGSDDHIGGSPFRTLVVANSIEPSLSWIYGPGLTYSEAGLSSKFFVQTRDMFGNNISFQGADDITPIFWDDSPAVADSDDGRRRLWQQQRAAESAEGHGLMSATDAAVGFAPGAVQFASGPAGRRVGENRSLMQVGVRQVAREGGLFEIIFYPFKEANGTLEVRVGDWSTEFAIAPRAVFQPIGDKEESQRLIIFAPVSSFALGLIIALVINRVQASYKKRKQRMEEAVAAAEEQQLKDLDGPTNGPGGAKEGHESERAQKPDVILARLLQQKFVTDEVPRCTPTRSRTLARAHSHTNTRAC